MILGLLIHLPFDPHPDKYVKCPIELQKTIDLPPNDFRVSVPPGGFYRLPLAC